MNWILISLIVLNIVFLITLMIVMGVSGLIIWKLFKSNSFFQEQNDEYKKFFDLTTQVLVEDTLFLRSDLVKRMGLGIPEVADLNSAIINFENKITAIRLALEKYKLVD